MNVDPRGGSRVRKAGHAVDPLFIDRWSPRAMSGAAVSQEALDRLFEAARWAPSSSNGQPWRFLYAHRDTPHWQTFFDLLVEGNQVWCKHAGVLVLVSARTTFEWNDKPAPTHAFDAGSAWMSLALQGVMNGLVVHGMAGFDYNKAREVLHVPDHMAVLAMIAIGHPGDPEALPEKLRERETPSSRKPITETTHEGPF